MDQSGGVIDPSSMLIGALGLPYPLQIPPMSTCGGRNRDILMGRVAGILLDRLMITLNVGLHSLDQTAIKPSTPRFPPQMSYTFAFIILPTCPKPTKTSQLFSVTPHWYFSLKYFFVLLIVAPTKWSYSFPAKNHQQAVGGCNCLLLRSAGARAACWMI